MNRKILLRKLATGALHNVSFRDFDDLVRAFAFVELRVRGSHHVYGHPALPEMVNLQDCNGEAKPYQIRQFLQLVEKYGLNMAQ